MYVYMHTYMHVFVYVDAIGEAVRTPPRYRCVNVRDIMYRLCVHVCTLRIYDDTVRDHIEADDANVTLTLPDTACICYVCSDFARWVIIIRLRWPADRVLWRVW